MNQMIRDDGTALAMARHQAFWAGYDLGVRDNHLAGLAIGALCGGSAPIACWLLYHFIRYAIG